MKLPDREICAMEFRKSVESATVAYYPFETTTPIPDDQLPKSRVKRGEQPPAVLVTPFRGRNGPQPEAQTAAQADTSRTARRGRGGAPRMPNSMIREKLVFSPSGLPGGEPAVLEEAEFAPAEPRATRYSLRIPTEVFSAKSVGFTTERSHSASTSGLCRPRNTKTRRY